MGCLSWPPVFNPSEKIAGSGNEKMKEITHHFYVMPHKTSSILNKVQRDRSIFSELKFLLFGAL